MASTGRLNRALELLGQWWEHPLHSGLAALVVYSLITIRWHVTWSATNAAYFNYLADAFLHGQLHLRLMPPMTLDLVLFNGQYFLYWPPLPAVLMMPFVAVFGVSFSDTLFTLAFGALNVVLVAAVLRAAQRREVINLTAAQRGWLVLFFALGTVHITLAPFARVWFTSQVVAFTTVGVMYLAALQLEGNRAFLGTGVGVAAALVTRSHLAFAGLWPLIYLLMHYRSSGWQRLLGKVLLSGIPVVIALALFGVYNFLRFDNVLDTGVSYHLMNAIFVEEFKQYGVFNLHYLPANIFYQFIAYPLPPATQDEFLMGGGLFWLSPLFIAAFWGVVQGRPRWSVWTLLLTIGLIATPIMLLMGTGYGQFGPRYTLDYTLPLLLLTAQGIRRWPLAIIALLTLLAIMQYLIGMRYWGVAMMQ